ncbi:MAG: hypothetical protein KDC41_15085, partial [Saprospiraceae bacterium]|nr:hypothetical protein [Saprospiraceae bacterium]
VEEGIAPCVPEYDVDGSDPCVCLNNATTLDNGQFGEFIQILSLAGQTWTLNSATGLYSTASAAPPAAPTPIPLGTVLTVGDADGIDNDNDGDTDEFDEKRFYTLEGIHVDEQGYEAVLGNNLGDQVSLANTCYYPTPYFANLTDPFCLNTPIFTVEIEELNGANGTVTIYIDGMQTDQFNALALGLGIHHVEAVFDAGGATGYLLVNGIPINGVSLQDAVEDPGCQQSIEQYVEVVSTPVVIACNNIVNISIEGDCVSEVTPDMVMEGDYYCYDDYLVMINYPPGTNVYNPPNMVDGTHVGYTMTYNLFHVQSGNVCGGSIVISDELPPEITNCPEDVQIYCTQDPDDLTLTGEPTYFDCSTVLVEYSDEYEQFDCAEDPVVAVEITRTWILTDWQGNVSTCVQNIEVLRGQLGQIDFPLDKTIFCNTMPPSLQPTYTGWPQIGGVDLTTQGNAGCNLGISFSDNTLNTCPGEYQIVRTWEIYDFCPPNGGTPVSTTHVQYIQVKDVPPTITLPNLNYDPVYDWYVISANGYDLDNEMCVAIGPLPLATINGVCNNIVNAFVSTPVGNTTNGGWLPAPGLPQGTHQVTYTVEDECGN